MTESYILAELAFYLFMHYLVFKNCNSALQHVYGKQGQIVPQAVNDLA